MQKSKFYWPDIILPAIAICIWAAILSDQFPTQGMRRKIFMSGCLTGAGSMTEDAAQKCFRHFLEYEALRKNGFIPKKGGVDG